MLEGWRREAAQKAAEMTDSRWVREWLDSEETWSKDERKFLFKPAKDGVMGAEWSDKQAVQVGCVCGNTRFEVFHSRTYETEAWCPECHRFFTLHSG